MKWLRRLFGRTVIDPAPAPPPVHRTAEQLLIETLNDQIAYLRGLLHASRQREDEIRRQNVLLVDQRAAWNSAALEERVVDRNQAASPGARAVKEALSGASHETEYGHFQNSLQTSGHIELEENGERTHRPIIDPASLTDEQIEQVMLSREAAVAAGPGHVDFQRG
jgi:hypothetical protein